MAIASRIPAGHYVFKDAGSWTSPRPRVSPWRAARSQLDASSCGLRAAGASQRLTGLPNYASRQAP